MAKNIIELNVDGTSYSVHPFVTCSTAAATAAKAVTFDGFSLVSGATINVKFSNKNTASTPTLNVNGTGAKNIFHNGTQITTGTNKNMLYGVVTFIYDGTQWCLVGNYVDSNTTYTVYTKSAVGPLDWGSHKGKVLGTECLAYWDGAYEGTTSNLTYCKNGTIIGSSNIGSQSVNYANSAGGLKAGTYINTHPENNGVIIPFMNNDLAFLLRKGGSAIVKFDDTVVEKDISNVFDGTASYWSGNNLSGSGYSSMTIELTLHKTFTWGETFYIDFGNTNWRAKTVKVEVINTNYADDVWTTKINATNNGSGHVNGSIGHTPVGASNVGGGFNKIRITLSDWNVLTDCRIAEIGLISYNSRGLSETCLSRGGGSVYGNILPFNNNTYNLGSDTNRWANIYGTASNVTVASGSTDAYRAIVVHNGNTLYSAGTATGKPRYNYATGDIKAKSFTTDGGDFNGNATTATTATNLASAPAITTSTATNQVTLTHGSKYALTVGGKSLVFTMPSDSNTTYSAGTGLSLSGTTFNHSNSVTAKTSYGSTATTASANGGTIKVTDVKYDAQGHITSSTDRTITLSQDHTKTSITAGTAGTSSATSGSTLTVPYVTVNANGHVTGYGTHTHTISGFLTSHQTIKQDGVTGATVNRLASCSTAADTAAKTASIGSGTFNLEAGARVSVKFANANTAGTPTLNINSKGAKNIFHKGSQITTGSNKALLAGVVDFVYDGTQWHLVGNYIDANTTYSVVTTSANGLVPKSDGADGTIDSSSTDWVLTNNNGSIGWYKLPANAFDNTTYSSKDAVSGGTDVSLVTTGEKAIWNAKTSNTGTVTSVNLKSGTGITVSNSGTAITTSGERTISLNTAKTDTIGGVKVAKDNSSYAVTTNTSNISADVTSGKYYGVEIDKNDKAFVYVPWTDTNTKVTSADNHYTPTAASGSELTASISGTAGTYAKDTEYTVLTGVKAQRDAKGHVTGLTYTAQKIKDTNTTYTKATAISLTDNSSYVTPQLLLNSHGGILNQTATVSGDTFTLKGGYNKYSTAISGSKTLALATTGTNISSYVITEYIFDFTTSGSCTITLPSEVKWANCVEEATSDTVATFASGLHVQISILNGIAVACWV